MATPTMRVCEVASGEDFTAIVTTDSKLATLDVEIVSCGQLSDARVRIVDDARDAAEILIVRN